MITLVFSPKQHLPINMQHSVAMYILFGWPSQYVVIERASVKVYIFPEGHKNVKKISHSVLKVLRNVKLNCEFSSTFVTLSKYTYEL
jgi:hypothetical protein